MGSGSRFITAAVAALGVSLASAGFLAARRSYNRPSVESQSVSAEPVPAAVSAPSVTAEPTPAAVPSPVAAPEVEPAVAPPSAPASEPERVVSKAAAPRPAARATTKVRPAAKERTPASMPPPAPSPVVQPVVESRTAPPPPMDTPKATSPSVDPPVPARPPAAVVEPAPIETPRPPVEIPRPQFEEHTLNADSVLGIRIDQSLSSATAKLEDRVTASLSRNVIVNGRTVLPTGTRLEGEVTLVQPGSKFKGRARLGVRFHTLVLADGMRVPIQTEALYRDGESATGSTAKKVGGGAAAGAILGGLLGGKKGAIIGAGVGVAGGTAAVMTGDTKDAVLDSGTPLTVRVTSPVTLTIERQPSLSRASVAATVG